MRRLKRENAELRRFNAILKAAAAYAVIGLWIERTYHRRRRQACLGKLTPIECETIMTTPATKAA